MANTPITGLYVFRDEFTTTRGQPTCDGVFVFADSRLLRGVTFYVVRSDNFFFTADGTVEFVHFDVVYRGNSLPTAFTAYSSAVRDAGLADGASVFAGNRRG